MIDTVQLVLLLVIVLLTSLLLVLGVQVFFILKGLRKTVSKANKVLDTAESITESVSAPLEAITSLTGIKAGSILAIVKLVKGVFDKDENKKNKD